MHWADDGAWTGEVSARMITECGATIVELGHSERREFFNETDEAVALKTAQAVRSGLIALVCVGDTHEEFRTNRTAEALHRQVSAALSKVDATARESIMIAYEPVWSIGERGTPAEPDFVAGQHALLKTLTADIMDEPLDILYGGSVNLAIASPWPPNPASTACSSAARRGRRRGSSRSWKASPARWLDPRRRRQNAV